jgi:Ran-binding protein 1
MRLQPNIGSDRSWVWKVAADYAESPPTSETLAIRFANSECKNCCIFGRICFVDQYCKRIVAGQFKEAFENAQKQNASLPSGAPASIQTTEESKAETKADEPPATSTDVGLEASDAGPEKATEEEQAKLAQEEAAKAEVEGEGEA